MNVTVTTKLRIYPNEEQSKLLLDVVTGYRDACQFVSETGFSKGIYDNNALHELCCRDIRKTCSLKSQLACSVTKTVSAAYKTIEKQLNDYKTAVDGKTYRFKKTLEWLLEPVSFKRPFADLVRNRDWKFSGDMLILTTLKERIKIGYTNKGFEKYFDGTWKFGTAKLLKKGSKWFLYVPATKKFESVNSFKTVVGCDRGLNYVLNTYDSDNKSVFYDGKSISEKRDKYARTRASLQKKGTKGSKRVLKRLSGRENGWMNDTNHCVSKALVESYDSETLFVLEDLSGVSFLKENLKGGDSSRHLRSWSFFDLEQKIEYKARQRGQTLIKVRPEYTSQRCPECGAIHKESRNREIHIYKCIECGYEANDDLTAARNICELGRRCLVGESASFSGEYLTQHPKKKKKSA